MDVFNCERAFVSSLVYRFVIVRWQPGLCMGFRGKANGRSIDVFRSMQTQFLYNHTDVLSPLWSVKTTGILLSRFMVEGCPKRKSGGGTPERDQQGPLWMKTLQATMEDISLKNRYFHSKNQKWDHRFGRKRY